MWGAIWGRKGHCIWRGVGLQVKIFVPSMAMDMKRPHWATLLLAWGLDTKQIHFAVSSLEIPLALRWPALGISWELFNKNEAQRRNDKVSDFNPKWENSRCFILSKGLREKKQLAAATDLATDTC